MWRANPVFQDRSDAGCRLAVALARYKGMNAVVMALPRGGVPVGFEVAKALDADLDIILVRKIGAPGHAELGIGAVVDGRNPALVLNEEIIEEVAPDPNYIVEEEARQLAEVERLRRMYRGDDNPVDLSGRVAIIVDDGIATGGTMKAALRGLMRSKPSRRIVAAPVASSRSLEELERDADEIVCLAELSFAISAHYVDFAQTSDDEVIRLLDEAKSWRRAASFQGC
jgi:putative phosphoribosyl transferase